MKNPIEVEFQLNAELWNAFKEFVASESQTCLDDMDSIEPVDEESRYSREKAIIKRQTLKNLVSTFESRVKDAAATARQE